MSSEKFKRYLLLVARGQPPVADFGMATPFHHPLPSRDPCDCWPYKGNFWERISRMAQIFLALNFGESSALESAENSDFFHVMQNLYAQSAQNLTSDQPPPFLYGTPVKSTHATGGKSGPNTHRENGNLTLCFEYFVS